MVAMWQTVHVHVSDPLVPHHAGGVPAIDHTVVAIPVEQGQTDSEFPGSLRATVELGQPGLGFLMPLFSTSFYLMSSHFS